MKARYGLLLGASLALVSLQSHAVTDCTGTAVKVLLYGDGTVNLQSSWRNDFTVICNINGTFGNISAEVCLSWYATATSAAAHGKQVTVYYAATYTCATLPTYWSAPAPTYFGVIG
jgi:hypothetical protein